MKCLIRQLFVKVIIFNGVSVFRFGKIVVFCHFKLATTNSFVLFIHVFFHPMTFQRPLPEILILTRIVAVFTDLPPKLIILQIVSRV